MRYFTDYANYDSTVMNFAKFAMRYFPTIFVDFQEIACSNQARNLRCGSLRIKSTWKFKRFLKEKMFFEMGVWGTMGGWGYTRNGSVPVPIELL